MILYNLLQASQLNGSPIMGRMKLDAMINYRGNYLFGTIR